MDDQEFHTAALVFAHYIGIDLDTEPELIAFAEDALDDLPPDWELGIGEGDNKGIPYYFNTKTDKSVWVHPKESKYRQIVEEERKKLHTKKQASKARDNEKDREKDRERGRDNRYGGGGERNDSTDLTLIEEFDDDPVAFEKPLAVGKAGASNQGKGSVNSGGDRPKFGMSADDFFDAEPEEPRDYSRLGSRDGVKHPDSPEKLSPQTVKSGAEKPEYKPIFSKNWLDDDTNAAKGGEGKSKYGQSSTRDKREDVASSRPAEGSSAAGLEKGVSFAVKREDNPDRDSRGGRDDKIRTTGRSSHEKDVHADDRGRGNYRRSDSRDHEGDRDRSHSRGGSDRDKDNKSKERDRSYDKSRDSGRDRDYDRDRARSSSPSSSRYFEDENRKLKAEVHRMTDELDREKRRVSELTTEKEDALERMRRDMNRVDADLAGKVAEVRRLQEEVDTCDMRTRRQADAAVEEAHSKHRESIRILKIELEDEWRARLDAAKKRSEEEVTDIRREVDATKKRLEDAADEAEQMRRKVINSREDGRSEASVALEASRAELRDMEEKYRLQSIELRRVKEDHASLSMKASGAMQSAQVSVAESEAVKAQATSAIAEAHSSQAALMMATQRLQQAETEASKIRAENTMLKREVDATSQELKKYQSQSFIASEGVTTAEAEARRSKARLQAEINRLTTRCSELGGLNSALQNEVDMASETKNQAVREVLQQLSKAEGEQHVLMLRLHDADERHERTLAAVAKSDAELRATRELLQKKERMIRDLAQEKEDISALLEDERSRGKIESESSRKEIRELRSKVQEAERTLRAEKDKMQEEMVQKIPEIAKSAAAEAEKLTSRENEYKLSALRSEYEIKIEQKTRDLIRTQTAHEEAFARLKASNADDKAEVERLRFHNRRLQRRCDELEADADDRRRQPPVSTPNVQYAIPPGVSVMYPTPQHAPYRYPQPGSESIDGTMYGNSLGMNNSQMFSNGSGIYPPAPPHPSQSIDANGTFASVEEKRFVEMMQQEIKGIQDQLSRSTVNAMGTTPAAPRWAPQHHSHNPVSVDDSHNRTMSYAADIQPPSNHQYYGNDNSMAVDNGGVDRSRDESRAWAELLAKQAKKGNKQPSEARSVGFSSTNRDENGHRSYHVPAGSPSGGADAKMKQADRSRGDETSPRKSGKTSRGSTPVKSSSSNKYEDDTSTSVPDAGYHPGYWKTKYMR